MGTFVDCADSISAITGGDFDSDNSWQNYPSRKSNLISALPIDFCRRTTPAYSTPRTGKTTAPSSAALVETKSEPRADQHLQDALVKAHQDEKTNPSKFKADKQSRPYQIRSLIREAIAGVYLGVGSPEFWTTPTENDATPHLFLMAKKIQSYKKFAEHHFAIIIEDVGNNRTEVTTYGQKIFAGKINTDSLTETAIKALETTPQLIAKTIYDWPAINLQNDIRDLLENINSSFNKMGDEIFTFQETAGTHNAALSGLLRTRGPAPQRNATALPTPTA